MPSKYRATRRRLDRVRQVEFTNERAVRAAVAAVRKLYATKDEAEASPEWRALRPKVARWILKTWRGLPAVNPEDSAFKITGVYLRAPHFLPMLPPSQFEEESEER